MLCIYISFCGQINIYLSIYKYRPGCIPCKVYAEDTPILTIDSIVICQTHAEDLWRRLLKMHPGIQVHCTKLWLHTCVLYNASSLTPLCVYMYCVTVIHMYMFGVKRIVLYIFAEV